MKVLFDTSVLIAATLNSHSDHPISQPWLDAAAAGRIGCYLSCHSLAEYYRVLTSIRSSPPLTSLEVWELIRDIVLAHAQVVELGQQDYLDCLLRLSQGNFRGGIVYDAIIVQAALKANVDKLLTLNSKHFERLWPNHTDQVINPTTTQAP